MKTKTIMFGAIVILAMALFASALVLAEDDSTTSVSMLTSENSNVVENVTDVSSGTMFWKNVGLWFTFNQERKMEKEMELAQLRLQQAEYATQNNKTKAVEKALDSYQKLMDRVNKRADALKDGSNISLGALKLAAMDQAILVHQVRLDRLNSLLATANLTDEQRAKLEEKIAHAENVTAHLEEVQSSKEERIKTRLMAQGNLTEVQAEAIIEDAKNKAEASIDKDVAAWKDFKDRVKANNMSPKEFAKEQKKDFRQGRVGNLSNSKDN